jgi:hypothetical protein
MLLGSLERDAPGAFHRRLVTRSDAEPKPPRREGVDHERTLDERERVARKGRDDRGPEQDARRPGRGGGKNRQGIGGDAAAGHPRALDACPFGRHDTVDEFGTF